MTKLSISLAWNLKYFREKIGLTQAELAQKAGINRSYLASIESGDQPNTTIKMIEKLAIALDVPPESLFHEPNISNRNTSKATTRSKRGKT